MDFDQFDQFAAITVNPPSVSRQALCATQAGVDIAARRRWSIRAAVFRSYHFDSHDAGR
jgi:hypothetical protein